MYRPSLLAITGFFVLGCMTILVAEPKSDGDNRNDWPQWQGPHRDSISSETGLLTKWPDNGPPLAWKTDNLGLGFSAPVIAAGKIYGMGRRNGQEGIWALDEATGKELWFTSFGRAPSGKEVDHNDGPRASVTVDGDLLFGLTCLGDLACLDMSGKIVWQTSFKENLNGKMMSVWGFSESPLVDGEKLIVTPGGDQNTMVAFNKKNGSIIWRASIKEGGGAGYASPVVMTIGNKKMYVTFLKNCLVAVDADDGNELWRYAKVAGRVANIPTPIVLGDTIFCTTGYTGSNGGSALLKIVPDGNKFKAQELWYHNAREFMNHHGGVVHLNGYFYGGHGQNQGFLTCLDEKTGKIMYQDKKPAGKGSAAVVYADGHLYYRYQDGMMVLVKVNPEKDEVISKFKLPFESGKESWPHPVICNGKLYIRDMDVLMCFNVKKG